MRKLKVFLQTLKQRVLQPPYLDRKLVRWTLFLIVSDTYLVLITQPRAYWLEHSFAQSHVKWLEPLLALHPLAYVGLALLYVLIMNFIITRFYAPVALMVWITTSFIHTGSLMTNVYDALLQGLDLNIPNASYTIEWGIGIVLTALLGFSLARAFPQVQFGARSAPRNRRWQRILATLSLTVWFLVLNTSLAHSMWIPDFGWIPVGTKNSPSPRRFSEVAYNLTRRRAVLFGGEIWSKSRYEWTYAEDTWEWDGNTWTQAITEIAPSGRIKHAMAYDGWRGVVVLFGGIDENENDLGDTWEWDGIKWEKRSPAVSPPARCCHAMVYHPQRGKVIAYGGFYGDDHFLYGAWEWDGQEWAAVSFTTEPLASGNDLIYDESLNAVVSFRAGRTWLWEDNTEPTWAYHTVNMEPPDRSHEALVYNPQRGESVLFGGIRDSEYLHDTWILRGQVWHRLELPLSPTKRCAHVMFYDPVRKTIVLWGGFNSAAQDDMWEFILPDTD